MTAPPAGALEACPFCGGRAEVMIGYHARTDAKVGCTDCSAEGPLFGSNDFSGGDHADDAIAAWNRRTHGPALLAALRLREGCEALVAATHESAAGDMAQCKDEHGAFKSDSHRMAWNFAAGRFEMADDLARVLEEGE